MEIRLDDLRGPEIAHLLQEHLDEMAIHSPPESRHALNLDGLRVPEVTFWSVWEGDDLMGCGALKELTPVHGEIKSMRTTYAHRGKGVAAAMVRHILAEAERRGYQRLSLETGAMAAFAPAHALYTRFGFQPCAPFANYREDPNSLFMTRLL